MEQLLFHVLLDGRKLGPYDRRTIVGMRIKEALSSDSVLVDASGAQLTVGDLIGRARTGGFQPSRTSGYSTVQAIYTGSLVAVKGRGLDIPSFKGEAEIRVQSEVLRIAGRFRHRFSWKEGRIKLILKDIVQARAVGSRVELWLRTEAGRQPQQLTLELFTPDAAGELAGWLRPVQPG